MIRRLIWLVAAAALWWLVSRFQGRARRRASASAPRRTTPRFEGAMVRDRVCQTFLPQSNALSLRLSGEEHFFCSERCRSTFLSHRQKAS